MTNRSVLCTLGIFCVLFCLGQFVAQTCQAVAPSEEALAKWRADGVLDEKLAAWKAFKAAGGCAALSPSLIDRVRANRSQAAMGADVVDTINAIVLLVDFPDWPWNGQSRAGTPANFDSILFSDRRTGPAINPTGSMTDFYMECSYGKLFIHGEIYGWYRMAQTYAWYVNGNDDGLSRGYILARDAVMAADPYVDYSRFATAGVVDGVIIIHPGEGAETGAYGIWSHMSTISGQPILDGVRLSDYTINPEEYGGDLTPIGVFCHEYGHVLGLPDLYDTDYSPGTSEGVGSWSLMASGSYNGNSQRPAHPDAWCLKQLGFLNFTEVPNNLSHVAIPAVEYNPTVYQIKDTNTAYAKEYWLIENRQAYGADAALPGHGLLIYHIDENVYGNNDYLRYMVAVEQADGLNQLALAGSRGDDGDPWPGGLNNRNFHDQSVPNSRGNVSNKVTEVGVRNISSSDSIMYADLDYVFGQPMISFAGVDSLQFSDAAGGNGNGVVEAGETIDVLCQVKNTMRNAYNWHMTLSTDNPDVHITANHTLQNTFLLRSSPSVTANNPVQFTFAPGAQATISDFTLTITADSVSGAGDETFTRTFNFRQPLGKPNVLVVDDDNGQGTDLSLTGSLNDLRIPQTVWHKTAGSPAASLLQDHKFVFWISGDKPTGTLTASDVAAMKAYLDAGGKLAIASATAAGQLKTLDSAFMDDYLHVRFKDSVSSAYYFYGVSGNPFSQGTVFRYLTTASGGLKRVTTIDPTSGGLLAFELSNSVLGTPYLGHCGVVYGGAYRTVFLSFALEFVSDRDTVSGYMHRDSLTQRILRFLEDTTSTSGAPQATALLSPGETQDHILPLNPTFAWSYLAAGLRSQDSAEVEFGTDEDWSAAELWDPMLIVGNDTTLTYAGVPLAGGQTFYGRVRVHALGIWSAWYQRSFRRNSTPPVPALLAPVPNGVLGNSSLMQVQTVVDGEGDPVVYDYVIYADSVMALQEYSISLRNSTLPVPMGALQENSRRWWRVRTYDGYEHSAWSALSPFWVDVFAQPPLEPTNLIPASGGLPVFSLKPALTWTASVEYDPFDTTHYTVELATSESFAGAKSSGLITARSFTFPDSLAYANRYWWRVTAKDRTGYTTQSEPQDFWTWRLGDLNHSHITDVSDLSMLISYLTNGGVPAISPKMVGDMSGDCLIDVSDLSRLVAFLTGTGAQLMPGC